MEVSLALGGGGIKGLAHVGVIKALEDARIKVRAIAGTSAGSLVGALYASGIKSTRMATILEHVPPGRLFSRSNTDGPSLLGMGGISHILAEELGDITFDRLKIPFACTAVDINTSSEVILMDGPVAEAVLASSAVPGVFPARPRGDALLVDGGVLDPVPVALARWLAPTLPVVAVVLSPVPESWAGLPPLQMPHSSTIQARVIEQMSRLRFGQALNIFIQSMDITGRMLAELRLQIDQPEVIIRPPVDQFHWLEEVDPQQLITLGEEAALSMMPDLHASYSLRGKLSRRMRRVEPPRGLVEDLD